MVEEVYAVRGPEKSDVQATFRFANGACGTIAYLTGGNVRFPKETLDATGGGRSARLDNFKTASVWSGRGKSTTKARGGQDKGQRSEMAAFVEAVRTGGPMPISVDSLLATTRATIAVGESLLSGRSGAGVSVPGSSKLGWYARRLGRMSPAEVAWRVREQAVRLRGRGGRSSRERRMRCRR